jgi:carboxyl-terminal processing protease
VFARATDRDLSRVLADLRGRGMKALILDLRFNQGGLLTTSTNVADLLTDDGLIVTVHPRGQKPVEFRGQHPGSLLDFPVVCLINGMSAAGTEIVAACLQDAKRAVVMGERSYGAGSVQNVFDFDGGELKLTTAVFTRPSGRNLDKGNSSGTPEDDWGVVPDKGFILNLSEKERADLEDSLKDLETIPPRTPDRPDRQLQMALRHLRGEG